MPPAARVGLRPLGPVTFAHSGIDRAGHRRSEPDLLAQLIGADATRALVVHEGAVAVTAADELALVPADRVDAAALWAYLGEEAGASYLFLDSPQAPAQSRWASLRQIASRLEPRSAHLAATAVALSNWHAAHQFCPQCGAPTVPVSAGWLRRCTVDGSDHYPRTDPAVIVAVVDDDDRLLLARGAGWPTGRFSVLAGFVEPGETMAEAVAREVGEEVGVSVAEVTLLGDQPWPFPTSLMVGFRARATTTQISPDPTEIAEAAWFTRDDLTRAVRAGTVLTSGSMSISRALIEHWYGRSLPSR